MKFHNLIRSSKFAVSKLKCKLSDDSTTTKNQTTIFKLN